MKNKKINIMFLLTLLSLLFINIFSVKVSANTGIVSDPGTTGLWHEVVEENQEYKAYVYMRWYYSWTPNLTKRNQKNDETHINPSMIPYSIMLGSAPRFDNPNNDFPDNYRTDRTLSAPTGFDTLHIQNISIVDGILSNAYVGTTSNIKISLFALYDIGSSTKNDLIITNTDNNQVIYQHKANDGNFIIYWTGQKITPPDYGDDPVNAVGTDYTKIPLLNRSFIQIDKSEVLHTASNTHRFYLNINFVLYSFDMSFPIDINIDDYKLSNGKLNMSYSSFKEERYLYLQPNKEKKPYPLQNGTVENPSDLMVGFISINISDPTNIKFDRIENLKLDTIISKEFNSNAYMYVFFPLPIEEIINIHVTYSYRLKYFGFNGEWKTEDNIYAWKETSNVKASWWMYIGPLAPLGVYGNLFNVFDIQTIKKITAADVPSDVKDVFYNDFNGTEREFLDYTKYKIHLGQFTAAFSTGYEFEVDYEKLELTYMYKGQIYNVDYKNMDHQGGSTEGKKGLDFINFFKFEGVNDLLTFLSHIIKYWQEAIITFIVLYIKLFIILPILTNKVRRKIIRRRYYR